MVATGVSSFAQSQLLPDRFSTWQRSQRPPAVLWPSSVKNAGEPLLAESGVVRIEEGYYQRGDQELTLRIWKLKDASGAYEVYTSQLKPGMLPTRLGQVAAFDKDGVAILFGNRVISTTANASRDDLNALVHAAEAAGGQAPLPPIPNYLPMQGRVPGSERYALGPAGFRAAVADLDLAEFATLLDDVGFKSGAETVFAQYRSPKDTAVLLLVEYPTPQLAEQHLRHLEQAISAAARQAGTSIERKGTLLSLVLRPSSASYGTALRSTINYETNVTWNEPHQTITDPPLLSTIAKIFIGTGVFMLVAVVLGVAFGGVRLLTKILFPGKVFDRPEQMDVLQLGLSGKRINSRDFY